MSLLEGCGHHIDIDFIHNMPKSRPIREQYIASELEALIFKLLLVICSLCTELDEKNIHNVL